MSSIKPIGANNLSAKLVQTAGIGSEIGVQVINYFENQLMLAENRYRLIKEWQTYISLGKGLGELSSTEVGGLELTDGEKVLCRQVYFAVVVLMVGWSYLVQGGISATEKPDLDSLINGQAFEAMGLTNLKLEAAPLVSVLGTKRTRHYHSGLWDAILGLDIKSHDGGDLFRPLYENLLPAKVRHAMGEHYTPEWLADHMLSQIGFHGENGKTLIDPACGSGGFLVEALSRKRVHQGYIDEWGTVVGIDVNPLAVLAAKVNYLIAAGFEASELQHLEIPVYQYDVILSDEEGLWTESETPFGSTKFDYVVGNPPWINWESLSPDYRLATLSSWEKYGLFSHSGMDTILGKGKKDFSTLMTLASAHRFLKPQGKMVFLITQGVFKSGGASEGFRDFRLPGGTRLKVLMVEDLSRLRPFEGVANRTAILYLEKGQPTVYPIPYRLWTKLSNNVEAIGANHGTLNLIAEPVNLADSRSPWMTYGEGSQAGLRKILGASDYRAREGANTGGANGIFWVEIIERPQAGLVRIRNLAASSRQKIDTIEAVIEDNLVYPLLKGSDVARWQANPSAHIILTQNPTTRRGISLIVMARNYPRTLTYLNQFKKLLSNRAAYRRYFKRTAPYYTMFDVGEYTLAPYKTVWHRFGNRMKAAVVEGADRPVIPQETHTMVACSSAEEAWYLAGVLNSLPVEYAISSYSMVGGKSFAGPNLLNYIRIPLYNGSRIQTLVAQAARGVSKGEDPEILTAAAVNLYGISDAELQGMKVGWEQLGMKP